MALVNGNISSGRVEVYHNHTWATVCDDEWDDADATVVCRMLGYSMGERTTEASFGPGNNMIGMDNVHCEGTESHILDCEYNGWGIHNCAHWEDAGVVCYNSQYDVVHCLLKQCKKKIFSHIPFQGQLVDVPTNTSC